jgi:hypothetical protein
VGQAFGGRLPHEFGALPLTYFQTLVDTVYTPAEVKPEQEADSVDEDGLKAVDVDELIRTGQLGRVEI